MVRQVIALPADEPVFFYPYMPVVPFVTRREQVSRFDVFLPHYMSETQYESAARDVTKHAKWVVYDRLMTNPRYIRQIYPKMPETLPPEFRAMEMLLSNKYVTVWSNQRYEIRRAR